ncbi:hypothetical protein MKW92_018258 [Papaver armeniacum]|nr:hypothetical protein MKW92_018258 [Papaver armeniacum]
MGGKKRTRVPEESEDEIQEDISQSSSCKDKILYEILGVEKTASQQEIKKAYYKLALRLHPDKNPDDEQREISATAKVISILGDEEKRALYDETGCVDDADLSGDVAQNMQEYFRTVFKKVTEADIEEFEANYRGSESEIKDLKELYQKHKGNMNRVFCSMLCSDPKLDSHSFRDILNGAIAADELKETKAYERWVKQVDEMKPPTERKKKSNKLPTAAAEDLLAVIIQQRKEDFDTNLTTMMSKYKEIESESVEPSEEEFEAARKRLESKKAKNASKKKKKKAKGRHK